MRYFWRLALITFWSFSHLYPQVQGTGIQAEQIRADIQYLASDQLEGRLTGTKSNELAAKYVADAMRISGLRPAGDSGTYFQRFAFVSTVKLGQENRLVLDGTGVRHAELRPDVDFRPFGFTSNATVTAPLVFVGYAISAPDAKYDDFSSIDVSGKIVVALRYSPDGNDPHSELYKYSGLREKARTARDHGARALILLTGPADEQEDQPVRLTFDHTFANSGIPAVSVKRAPFEALFNVAGFDIRKIQDSIKATRKPVTFDFQGATVTLQTDVQSVEGHSANVAGYLEGTDLALKNQVIIVGAHFDHLGFGGPGSGSLMPDTNAIHHGADDNASGTAGMLALARAFAPDSGSLKRTILFLGFSGEELGELGSAYYVNHPFLPLDRTILMANLDMVGRLSNRALTVYGAGTSPAWAPLLAKEDADSTFTLKEIADGYGPSDQAQFYAKDIPVLFFFTGTHNDYHKPSDTWDKINYPGEEAVVRFVYRILNDVETSVERPAFTKAASSAPQGGDARGFSVTLGIIPDYGDTQEGMKIGGIRPNGPAEKAGLKSGDVIVKMAGKKVLNIYDYMGILGSLKAGDVVEVEVKRGENIVKATATMTRRN